MKGYSVIVAVAILLFFPFAAIAVGQKVTAAEEKVTEISWLIRAKSGEDTTWCINEVNKKFNVKIVPNGIDTNDGEKVSVMLAAGEFPDAGYIHNAIELYQQGVLRGIPVDMIRKYAPNYTRRLDQDHPEGWLMFKLPDNEKERLGILGIGGNVGTNLHYLSFRVDWAAKVGFTLPDYDQKKRSIDIIGRSYLLDEDFTLEWFEKLLVAFRDKDPDGNGKNDTIPLSASKYKTWTFGPIMGAFGITEGYNLIENGELTDWCIASGYKEFLKMAAKWYAMGLVDKEFVNLDLGKAWEKIAKGITGASVASVSSTGDSTVRGGQGPPNAFASEEEVSAGAEVVIIPPVMGPGGQQGCRAYWPVGALGDEMLMIGRQVDDAKLAKILQIIDYIRYGDLEGWIFAFYGKPGIHFDWQGEPWKSPGIRRDYDKVPAGYPKEGSFGTVYPSNYDNDRLMYVYSRKIGELYKDYLLAPRGQQLSIRPYRWDLLNETQLTDLKLKYKDDLDTIVDEFYFKAIIGELDIDEEWDSYVADWRKSGGDQMLAEYKKAPIVSELRKGKVVY